MFLFMAVDFFQRKVMQVENFIQNNNTVPVLSQYLQPKFIMLDIIMLHIIHIYLTAVKLYDFFFLFF